MGNYLDLLIVEAEGRLFAVEAPMWDSCMGNLVVFDTTNAPYEQKDEMIGRVIERCTYNIKSDEYRCWKMMCPTYPVKEIYCLTWSAETEKSQAPGTDEERSVSNE